jgi:hypothetical protein
MSLDKDIVRIEPVTFLFTGVGDSGGTGVSMVQQREGRLRSIADYACCSVCSTCTLLLCVGHLTSASATLLMWPGLTVYVSTSEMRSWFCIGGASTIESTSGGRI